ncbi:hypothetical protein [Streptomyces aurantiacus]|uniref:hypothetical protein n=1 Tax=Streptomyces aurantiacus TaxID=47760 RepID=UPI0012FEF66F|nr:hypothetical protein [Streptomyces aurantiacus]
MALPVLPVLPVLPALPALPVLLVVDSGLRRQSPDMGQALRERLTCLCAATATGPHRLCIDGGRHSLASNSKQ